MILRKSLSKMLFALLASALVITWSFGAVAARAGDPGGAKQGDKETASKYASDQPGSDPASKEQTNYGSHPGMNRYLVVIPHSGTSGNCQNAIKEFSMNMGSSPAAGSKDKSGSSSSGDSKTSSMGSSSGKSMGASHSGIWQWGCSTDDQTLYLFTSASSEEAALSEIPSSLRNDAKVIALTNFASNQMSQPAPMQPQQKKSGSMKY